MNLLWAVAGFMLVLLVMLLLMAAASSSRENVKSEGFVFFLLGPLPVVLRGKPWVALIAAAAIVILFLLVMM